MSRSEEAETPTDKATESALQWLAPPLSPKIIKPVRRSKIAAAVQRLEGIEHISVSDVVKHEDDGKNYYVIEIFHRTEHSRIPTNLVHRQRSSHGPNCRHRVVDKPDYTIHHRFSEFEQLMKDIWFCVQRRHGHYCGICDRFMFKLLFSLSKPGVVSKTLIPSAHFRAKTLDKFLHKVMGECQLISSPRCRSGCYLQDHLPVIFDAFLFGGESHEDEDELLEDAAASPIGRWPQ